MILPAFNVDDCLGQAMDSLINQTIGFENIEVIIVDDCSTDSTKELIKHYENTYDNCKGIFLDKNNGGAGIPRNVGIKYATSNYLMFMDPDDEYEYDACEVFYDNILSSNSEFVYSHWTFVAGDKLSKTSHPFLKETKEFIFDDDDNIKNYHKYYRPGMCAGIYNKEFIINNNLECTSELGEDSYFNLEAIFNAKKIMFIEYYGYYNKLRDNEEKQSITNIRDEKRFKSRMKAVYLFYELLESYGCENNLAIIYDELKVLIYQVYTLMPSISNDIRRKFFNEIYDLEINLQVKQFDIIYFNFLNFFIINKHFKIAIFISNLLGRIYDNHLMRKLIRKVSLLISNNY